VKFIKPSEISARILTLLDESDQWVIIVSPYLKISKWYKFMNKINGLEARNIIIKIYVRDDPENKATFRDLDRLSLEYKKIPHLHCKLYMNERYGIVTSMNLLLSSEISSLEIGYATESWAEYNQLLGFYYRYVHIGETVHCDSTTGGPASDLQEVMWSIEEELNRADRNSWLCYAENALHISTGRNNYSISINEGFLWITAYLGIDSTIIKKSVQHPSSIVNKIRDLTSIKVNILPGSEPGILHLSGQAQQTLQSTWINRILESELVYVMESVTRFIEVTDDFVFH
jgi:hypothetical protein